MAQAQTYTLGQKIQLPIRLRDEDGIEKVYAVFRLLASPSIGPSTLVPGAQRLILEGDGEGQTEAPIEVSGEVTEELLPGVYLCVAIHVRDTHDHLDTIENPTPTKVLQVGRSTRGESGKPAEFLGWE